jgi:glycosyltransferase involved in cell wall biosynthesis
MRRVSPSEQDTLTISSAVDTASGGVSATGLLRQEPLRVLFINDTSRNGGPGRTILYVLKFLDSEKIMRTVLLPRAGIVSQRLLDNGVSERLIFEPDFVENIFEPFSRPMKRPDFSAPWYLKGVRAAGNVARATRGIIRLVRRVRRERYDLVFCNGSSANVVGGVVAALTKCPVIWHVLYPSVGPGFRSAHAFLAKRRNVRSIVCVSRATQAQFAHCAEKVRALRTALDIEEFAADAVSPLLRKEFTLEPDVVVFGSHGRILPWKGYVELIRAARIVFDKLGRENRRRCRFVVLGDTPEDLHPDHLQECRELVRELDLEDVVHFVGFRPDVRSYVSEFDVAVVPSVYEDPMPRAVMEAMAMSKPVVAFAMGGISEMIADGVEGRLVRGIPPDIDGLASACLSYLADGAMRARHGAAARRRVERDFSARKNSLLLMEEMLRVATASPPRKSWQRARNRP